MAVPMHVLDSMGGFPINVNGDYSIMFLCDSNVQEWHRAILP